MKIYGRANHENKQMGRDKTEQQMIGISLRKLMKASSVVLDVAFTYFHRQLEIIMNNTN